jgi:hypothetical protein
MLGVNGELSALGVRGTMLSDLLEPARVSPIVVRSHPSPPASRTHG